MANKGRTKTGVRRVDDVDIAKEMAMGAAGVTETPAAAAKVHTFTSEAFDLVNSGYLGCKTRFNWDSWKARVEFLRKQKSDPSYSLTVDDVKELIFTEEIPESVVDAYDVDNGQPGTLEAGRDNIVALVVIPFKNKEGHENPNAGDLLRNGEGQPVERGLSLTFRAEGKGPQPLEVLTFGEKNRKIAEQLARSRKPALHLTSYRQASARAAAINGNEGKVNSFLERKGAVRRERDERDSRHPSAPRTPRGQARFERR